MWKHREVYHANSNPEFQPKPQKDYALTFLAEQNLELMEEIQTLKKDFKSSFIQLASDIVKYQSKLVVKQMFNIWKEDKSFFWINQMTPSNTSDTSTGTPETILYNHSLMKEQRSPDGDISGF